MGSKMKGIYKGFKYSLTHLFVAKEREMEIGSPTDVKHVAHIGWDGSSGSAAPSWMNEFKTGPDFTATSIARSASTLSPWSSQDLEVSMQCRSESDLLKDGTQVEILKRKEKPKKSRATSSPKFSSAFSGISIAVRSKAKNIETNMTPRDIKYF